MLGIFMCYLMLQLLLREGLDKKEADEQREEPKQPGQAVCRRKAG